MTADREAIKAHLARATKVVEVPQWGTSVTLHALSVKEDRHVKAEVAKIGATVVSDKDLIEATDAYRNEHGVEALAKAGEELGIGRDTEIVKIKAEDRPRLLRKLGRFPRRTMEQADQADHVNLLMLSYSLRDEAGKQMFTVEELEDMATVNAEGQMTDVALEVLVAECYQLNLYTAQAGNQGAEVEDLAKKS